MFRRAFRFRRGGQPHVTDTYDSDLYLLATFLINHSSVYSATSCVPQCSPCVPPRHVFCEIGIPYGITISGCSRSSLVRTWSLQRYDLPTRAALSHLLNSCHHLDAARERRRSTIKSLSKPWAPTSTPTLNLNSSTSQVDGLWCIARRELCHVPSLSRQQLELRS